MDNYYKLCFIVHVPNFCFYIYACWKDTSPKQLQGMHIFFSSLCIRENWTHVFSISAILYHYQYLDTFIYIYILIYLNF